MKTGNLILSTDLVDVYEKPRGKGVIYTIIEKDVSVPWIFKYSSEKGNLTRNRQDMSCAAEMRSTSRAFHKNNPSKMEIPNDLPTAIQISEDYISEKSMRPKSFFTNCCSGGRDTFSELSEFNKANLRRLYPEIYGESEFQKILNN